MAIGTFRDIESLVRCHIELLGLGIEEDDRIIVTSEFLQLQESTNLSKQNLQNDLATGIRYY